MSWIGNRLCLYTYYVIYRVYQFIIKIQSVTLIRDTGCIGALLFFTQVLVR